MNENFYKIIKETEEKLIKEKYNIANEEKDIVSKEIRHKKELEKDFDEYQLRHFIENVALIGSEYLILKLREKAVPYLQQIINKILGIAPEFDYISLLQKRLKERETQKKITYTSDIIDKLTKLTPFIISQYYNNKFFVCFEFPQYIINSVKSALEVKNLIDWTANESSQVEFSDILNLIFSSTLRKISNVGAASLEYSRISDYSNFFTFGEVPGVLSKVNLGADITLTFKNPVAIAPVKNKELQYYSVPYFIWRKIFESIASYKESSDYSPPFGLDSTFLIKVYILSDFVSKEEIPTNISNINISEKDYLSELFKGISIHKKYYLFVLEYNILAYLKSISSFSLSYGTGQALDYNISVTSLFNTLDLHIIEFDYLFTQSAEFFIGLKLNFLTNLMKFLSQIAISLSFYGANLLATKAIHQIFADPVLSKTLRKRPR